MPISPIQEMMSRPAHTHIMSRPSLPKLPIHTEMMPTSAVSPASPTVTSPSTSTSTRTLSTSPLTITSDDSMCGMRTLLFLLSTPRPSITRSQSEMSPTTHHTRHTTRSSVPMSPSSPTSLSRSSTLSHIDEMEMELEEPPRDASSPPPSTSTSSSDVCSIWSPFAAIARTFTCFRSALPLQPPTPPPAPIDEFVILTASPLVLDPVSLPHGPTPITPLHTRDEQQSLRSLLKHSGHQTLHPIFRHLSLRTLGEELINQPAYLHLSGHGTHLADGTYVLAFEHDAHGSADLIDMDTLSRLVETSYGSGRGGAPKFVILSACYSEHAAHVFVKAGAQHVVAVRATERISDTAARTFSKWIWTALLAGHTVKRAFEIACVHVDVAARPSSPAVVTSSPPLTSSVSMPLPSIQTIPEDGITSTPTSTPSSSIPTSTPPPSLSRPTPRSESSKFVLLPADGNHDVILFPSPRHIRTSSQTSQTSISSQPSHRKMISYDSSTLPTSSRSTRTASDVANPTSVTLPLFLRYTSTSPLQDRCLPTSRTPIITPNPSNSNLPALPDHLIGRECDIHRIIRTLATHRVVNVHGQAKLGKSCVAIGAAHYMAERGFFQDGCYFLSMTAQLVDETSIVANLCYVLGINTSISSLRRLLAIIKDWDILLILDDGSSHYSVALIVQIIRNTTRIKIISTSVQNQTLVLPSIHQSASITMGQVPIRQLSPNHCIQLIRVLCASHPQASPLVALNDRQILTLIHACHYSPYHIRLAIRAYQSKTAQQQQEQHDHMIDISRISTSSDLQHEEISQHRISLSESTLVA